MISAEQKQKVVTDLGASKTDTGSASVQVGLLTARIEEITVHLKSKQNDHAARRGLIQMVGKRKKLLKYIAEQDSETYLALISKLGLRR